MAYYVNKTDGTSILVLDGTKDTSATSLTLFGRLVQTYGENINENFVWLLENFALDTSPANPVTGQAWYDTSVNNLKVYDASLGTWTTVGSDISGNIALSGNLLIGPNSFKIQDYDGNVTISNKVTNGNISFFSNANGTYTNTLHLNGSSGLITVNANATNNFGITTKIYVDSEIAKSSDGANVALAANVAIINANLAVRTNEETSLLARITAANAQIALRDTITRVDSINSVIDTAIQNNVSAIYNDINNVLIPEINARILIGNAKITAANVEIDNLRSNITAANASITALELAIQSDISDAVSGKAPIAGPTFTGTVRAPTPSSSENSTIVATTAYVRAREIYWDGSQKFVSTDDPASTDGSDGDIWLKYS
jgi:hypothetical protein